jgi:hypothetical protein
MSQKADARALIFDRYPSAITQLSVPGGACEANMVIIDSMQEFKGSAYGAKKWGDLPVSLSNNARVTKKDFPRVKKFVLCYDDYRYVTFAKCVEQNARAQSSGRVNLSANLKDFSIGAPDDPVGYGYSDAVHDREHWCREILRFVCIQWATDESYLSDFLVEGDQFIVNGHYLRYFDLDAIGVAVSPNAPLVITRIDGRNVVSFLEECTNTLGEGDLSMLFMMDHLVTDGDSVLLYSIDSDLLWYLMRLLEVSSKRYNVFWRYWPMLFWCVTPHHYHKLQEKHEQKWCFINGIMNSIWEDKNLSVIPLRERITSLTILFAMAGNDYIESIYRVPIHHIMAVYMMNIKEIGSLVLNGEDLTSSGLNVQSFKLLIECAVIQASSRTKNYILSNSEKLTKANQRKRTLLKSKISDREKDHRAGHMRFFLYLLNNVNQPVVHDPNLSFYGYTRIKFDQPPSRHNLDRMLGDGPKDYWDRSHQPELPLPALPGRIVVRNSADV